MLFDHSVYLILRFSHRLILHLSPHALLSVGAGAEAAPGDLRHGDVLRRRGRSGFLHLGPISVVDPWGDGHMKRRVPRKKKRKII